MQFVFCFQNIELKVEMENHKKDLVEKQALLEKAS